MLVTVTSSVFTHAVHFNIPGDYRMSDHYFDLLPGERRTVRIYDGSNIAPDSLSATGVVP
ncbi:MAG: hypothetical protein E4H02_04365 [Lentisphaerales bacterium]|jgi:hypothetical protein|nr:MAG: hypothetical protein E4H02_04365 [Lentisphaerales bacterium]